MSEIQAESCAQLTYCAAHALSEIMTPRVLGRTPEKLHITCDGATPFARLDV